MVLSYIVGQKKNPIPYPMKDIAIYVAITGLFFCLMQVANEWHIVAKLAFNTLLILLFVAHIIYHDLPLGNLPVIGKYFRK